MMSMMMDRLIPCFLSLALHGFGDGERRGRLSFLSTDSPSLPIYLLALYELKFKFKCCKQGLGYLL